MNSSRKEFCRDCKYCCKVREVDGYAPFCDNPLTKELQYPIGFLSHDARTCQYFRPAAFSPMPATSRAFLKAADV